MFQHRTPINRLLNMKMLAGSKAVEATATGNPLTFLTDLARPLKSLLIPFTPIQQGTGDPSPSNIRDIVPRNGLKVFQLTGVNHWDEQWETGQYNAAGNPTTGTNQIRSKNLIPVEPETEYYFYIGTSVNCRIYFCREDGSIISFSGYPKGKITTPANCKWLKFHTGIGYGETYNNNISINFPATETGYEPFKTETDISFPSPVYGGTLSVVSGVLRVQWAGFSATWGDGESATDMGEGITRKVFPMVDYLQTGLANNMCNIAPYQASENATVHFYYSGSGATNRKCRLFLPSDTPDTTAVTVITKLSQTYEVQLTPAQITALVGDNTIWSDADGSMTAVYLKKA